MAEKVEAASKGLVTLGTKELEELSIQYRNIAQENQIYKVKRDSCRIPVSPGKFVNAELRTPMDHHPSVALVCTHPWAVMGGNMHNNVPSFIAGRFAQLGYTTVKFNFRSGTFSRGKGEIDDVRARVGANIVVVTFALPAFFFFFF